jgi:predicted RNA binding protein YcfA (HicA-like mRNA interferase family)
MPKKIRELKAMLNKAGFHWRPGKGSHTVWYHAIRTNVSVAVSGHDGDDAPAYLEHKVKKAIRRAGGKP